jgi:hypothetical protein
VLRRRPALFAGVVLGSRLLAFIVPIAAMAISDALLGSPDWQTMIVVYAAVAMPVALGLFARQSEVPTLILSLAVASSMIFFVATNFAVWTFSGMYTPDAAGLLTCYVAALPFFKNSIMGDLFWTAVLFGTRWIWLSNISRLRHSNWVGR